MHRPSAMSCPSRRRRRPLSVRPSSRRRPSSVRPSVPSFVLASSSVLCQSVPSSSSFVVVRRPSSKVTAKILPKMDLAILACRVEVMV